MPDEKLPPLVWLLVLWLLVFRLLVLPWFFVLRLSLFRLHGRRLWALLPLSPRTRLCRRRSALRLRPLTRRRSERPLSRLVSPRRWTIVRLCRVRAIRLGTIVRLGRRRTIRFRAIVGPILLHRLIAVRSIVFRTSVRRVGWLSCGTSRRRIWRPRRLCTYSFVERSSLGRSRDLRRTMIH